MSMEVCSCFETVGGVLDSYANRGVFRGFSQGPVRNGKVAFKMLWHRDRVFELILDVGKHTMRFPLVLPGVSADSLMYREFRAFLKSRHSEDLPEHRRIDTGKARIRCCNRGRNISITLTVEDGDYEYGTRKLIHIVHEIFMVFLSDGRYYEYLVEKFDLDPDSV